MSHKRDDEVPFEVTSIFGACTGLGLVEVRFGEEHHQIPPEKARELAMMLLSGAESAESDAAVISVMTAKAGVPMEVAASMLPDMRAARTAQQKKVREGGWMP